MSDGLRSSGTRMTPPRSATAQPLLAARPTIGNVAGSRLLRLLEPLYESAVRPQAFNVFLRMAGEELRASVRVAVDHDLEASAGPDPQHDLKEAAARLRVSVHTVRSQLKAVLEKTGTHSQAELVRLSHAAAAPGNLDGSVAP